MNTAKKEKTYLQDFIKCNKCGQILKTEHQMGKEDTSSMITIEISWGYFSRKDGEIHKIHLCEDCYDAWIHSFQIPVEIKEKVELL